MSTGRLAAALAVIALIAVGAAVVVLAGAGEQDARGQRGLRRGAGAPHDREREDHGDHGLRAAQLAARAFLAGYLPLSYGEAGATAAGLRAAAPRLIARLQADPGRVSPAQAAQRAVVDVVSVIELAPSQVLATAQLRQRPSGFRYVLVFRMLRDPRAGWVVTRLGGA